jgi:heterodisulfide reductase subunit C
MNTLKRVATEMNGRDTAKKSAFYRLFVDNVRRNGRVQEFSLMMRYFLAMRDPLLPLGFTRVAVKLTRKGKLHMPDNTQKGKLEAMFRKAAEIEGQR